MIAITNYTVESLGLSLPEACIEIKEVNSATGFAYSTRDEEGNTLKRNTLVRFKVWVDEKAYIEGKDPVAYGEKQIDFTPANQEVIHNFALDLTFPNSTIK